MTRPLHIVATAPEAEPVETPPSMEYEHEHRRRIMGRDWSRVHVEADRRAPFASVLGRWG